MLIQIFCVIGLTILYAAITIFMEYLLFRTFFVAAVKWTKYFGVIATVGFCATGTTFVGISIVDRVLCILLVAVLLLSSRYYRIHLALTMYSCTIAGALIVALINVFLGFFTGNNTIGNILSTIVLYISTVCVFFYHIHKDDVSWKRDHEGRLPIRLQRVIAAILFGLASMLLLGMLLQSVFPSLAKSQHFFNIFSMVTWSLSAIAYIPLDKKYMTARV